MMKLVSFAKDLEEVLDSAAADLRITVCALMESDQLGPKLFSGTIKEFCEDMRGPRGEVAKEWRIAEILRYKDSRYDDTPKYNRSMLITVY